MQPGIQRRKQSELSPTLPKEDDTLSPQLYGFHNSLFLTAAVSRNPELQATSGDGTGVPKAGVCGEGTKKPTLIDGVLSINLHLKKGRGILPGCVFYWTKVESI